MTRKEKIIEQRKRRARAMQKHAQRIEDGTIGVQAGRNLPIITAQEKALLLRAEELGLQSAQITRRIANRMEQIQ